MARSRSCPRLGYPESSRKSLNTKERNFHAKWGLEEMGDSLGGVRSNE